MRKISYLVLNLLSFGLAIFMNYLFSRGFEGRKSVGEISNAYPVDITPAGFTFAIWGLIYLGLCILCIQLIKEAVQSSSSGISERIGPWFIFSNLFNAAWIYFWTSEMLLTSVVVIIALLISLITLVIQTSSLDTGKYFSLNFITQSSLRIYAGWVIAATVLNVSIWISTFNFSFLSYPAISVGVLVIAATIYVFAGFRFTSLAIPLVGSWAFWGIGSNSSDAPLVSLVAMLLSGVMVALSLVIATRYKKLMNH